MTDLRVTKLERSHGYWQANVTTGGATRRVDLSSGSWLVPLNGGPAKGHEAREVRADIAAELQRKVRRIERAERRAAQ